VDVQSVGAGGGSIAHVPITGALRVGPQSAGADPGPACYGMGGAEPTVTDANLVLGHLPPKLLGGEMELNVELARAAVQKIADAIGLSLYETAQGIIDIVNENMFGALRLVSVQRGYDPRDFALVAFGGAGPLHVNALSRLAGAWPGIVPPTPGVLSALGFLHSDIRNEFARTYIRTLDKIDWKQIKQGAMQLEAQARQWLAAEGIAADRQRIEFEIDLRYYRQGYEFPIRVSPDQFDSAAGLDKLVADFKEIHERNYGFNIDSLVEVVNLRALAIGEVRKVELQKFDLDGEDASRAVVEEHTIHFQGGSVPTLIYDRGKLHPGNVIKGPAIVMQTDSTTVILPDHYGKVDQYLNILIRPNESLSH
jgi:N-methylhydantoinase A